MGNQTWTFAIPEIVESVLDMGNQYGTFSKDLIVVCVMHTCKLSLQGVCMRVSACVPPFVRACLCSCVRASVRACGVSVCACVCVYVGYFFQSQTLTGRSRGRSVAALIKTWSFTLFSFQLPSESRLTGGSVIASLRVRPTWFD